MAPLSPNLWVELDHVQLAMPSGAEEIARRFYVDLLGMVEVSKPAALASRGGIWLRTGKVELHLGVETDFRPARKAHPAIMAKDLAAVARELTQSGVRVVWDDALPERTRFYTNDFFGNRLEFIQIAA
jgi:catechol 2,3-dioxygenase-like lactoylglutathione lyase family enzyme